MKKIRTFLSESLKNECTESKEQEHSNKIPSSHTSLQATLMTAKLNTFIVEALSNYTHKSFITFFTVGLIFLICIIIEFGRQIWTTSTSTKPEAILVYYLGLVLAVCIFSLTFFLLFVFWEVLQHAIDRTTWGYNCLRVLFFIVDVITAVKWYSAAIQARSDGIQYIIMASYIKAGSLALLGFLFLMWCMYRQCKNKTFQSLLKLKLSFLIFLSIHITLLVAFKHQGISWQTTALVCCLFYLSLALCVMVFSQCSEEISGLVIQIKITDLLIVLYVIIISLFLAVHYDMDCDNHCGEHTLPSTQIKINQNLDDLDITKVVVGEFTEFKELTHKINQTRKDYNLENCDNHCGEHTLPSTRIKINQNLDDLDITKVVVREFTEFKELTCKIN
ncbi:uncharacterized protein LOC116287793 isoform X2 [Actinia tenebrosa]|uniref:Uncharacterized protein LOC116287793 isoform X2 n=1 Tax=Actinia tenebrosa TaxID=6105 RepID=A0A6P8H465_ACTTE|nr:uncharacterized protein LOC116287793 isoform X2 [Actinia tenebrosa]